MNEYLSKEAVMQKFFERGSGYIDMLAVKILVDEIPVADVQTVKRGRWIKQEGFWNKNTVKCSLCGNYLDMNGVNGGRSDANYCPNCGARMEGDQNNE